jgi:subtilisin family serine protease
MRRALRLAAFAFALGLGLGPLGGAGAPAAAEPPPAPSATPQIAGQQILVLVQLPPAHFQPNANYGGGYGDPAAASARRRIGDKLARAYGLARVTDWPIPSLSLDCIVLSVPADRSADQVMQQLAHDPRVAWSQPMNTFHGQAAAYNDPLFPAEPAAGEWRLAELHKMATGRKVRVAVVDSQVDARQPDLIGQIAVLRSFVVDHPAQAEEHGTSVAGVIAAIPNNGRGVVGIAPGARILALRACWEAPPASAAVCDSLSLARAVDFAIGARADIINMSLSGPSDLLIGKLLDIAQARGSTVVAAFDRGRADGGFPASHPGVIAVANEDQPRPRPGVYLAPGRDVPTTGVGDRWILGNGSSYAAAHVAGLLALIRERRSASLQASKVVFLRPSGSIDACISLRRAAMDCGCACPPLTP